MRGMRMLFVGVALAALAGTAAVAQSTRPSTPGPQAGTVQMPRPGAMAATLGYYRAMIDPAKSDPALQDINEACDQPIRVPTLALCGSNDLRSEMLEPQKEFFVGPYEWAILDGCGHFLHRERPAEVTRRVIEWLQRP